jgi:predicted ArsR family transcriptional regulator
MLRRLRRDVSAVAALDDELRRRMYLFVRAQGRPVSRDEVAAEAGVSRKLAAFHLDKLASRGLLTTTYARPQGRSGRGAGRSAKFYEPSERELDVSIPERNYDVIGSILLGAIESEGPGERADQAAHRVARQVGEEIGRRERERRRLPRPGAERALAVTTDVLTANGYEPYLADGSVRVRSCPFHALAEKNRDIVCSLNRELVQGVVTGLGNETLDVASERRPGECCVAIRSARRSGVESSA